MITKEMYYRWKDGYPHPHYPAYTVDLGRIKFLERMRATILLTYMQMVLDGKAEL